MKRYKLLKDLPTFKAGDEFYIDSNNDLRLKGRYIIAYNHYTLEKFPNILTDWFEEVHEEYKRWRAEYRHRYYYINCCEVGSATDIYSSWDDLNYKIGNYFKTEKEAEAYKEYLLARQVLLDDAEGGKFYYTEDTWFSLALDDWCAYYDDCDHKWVLDSSPAYYPGIIYFKTQKALKESLKRHKEQWDIVRKYEAGK